MSQGASPFTRRALPTETQVRNQLRKILNNSRLQHSPRASRFLRFLVLRWLAQPDRPTSERDIAFHVFDKRGEFDPHSDPTVRVEAGRLRARLNSYYESEGINDFVRITLPPKTYTLEITVQLRAEDVGAPVPNGEVRSLGVAQFSVAGEDKTAHQFAESLCAELLHQLALTQVFRTVLIDAQQQAPEPEQARIDAAVKGSVIVAGNRTRVNAYLLRSSNRSVLYSESFENRTEDVPGAMEQIAAAIVEGLSVKLGIRLAGNGRHRSPSWNLGATLCFLHARHQYSLHTRGALLKCREHLADTLRLDPSRPTAHAFLGEALVAQALQGLAAPAQLMPQAQASALASLSFDARCGWAYEVLGAVSAMYDWDSAAAERFFRNGASVSAGMTLPGRWYGLALLVPQGRYAEAIHYARAALELDPRTSTPLFFLAWLHYLAGNFQDAIHLCRGAAELIAATYLTCWCEGLALQGEGNLAQAIRRFEEAQSLAPDVPSVTAALACVHNTAGNRDAGEELIGRLERQRQKQFVSAFDLAVSRLGRQENAKVADLLDAAIAERAPRLVTLGSDARFASLHSDDRYRALVSKLQIHVRT
jgi:TolB-like protein/tetratricopeptide (TPR) repeat protein